MMPRIEVFRAGLRELGYVDGENIIIEVRSAEGKRDRLPVIMAELLSLKVDIIVSAGAGVTGPAKEATSTIPIVMSQDPDPVASAFVASLARPGGNITGLSTFRPELSGKRLELVKETLPKLSRMAVFGTSSTPGHAQALKEVELAAAAVKVQLQYVDVLDPKDFETAFRRRQRTGWRCPMAGVGPSRQWSSKKDFRPRRKEPTPGHIRAPIMGGRRGAYELRS
jgi:ABC-type uncharacterized transport system substrate-binding protein